MYHTKLLQPKAMSLKQAGCDVFCLKMCLCCLCVGILLSFLFFNFEPELES